MPSSLDAPHGTTLAALKGIAIASSFLFAGNLATTTAHVPSLYASADYSHRLAAQQFTHQYRSTKKILPPTIIATGVIFSSLAFIGYQGVESSPRQAQQALQEIVSGSVKAWKLYGAAAVMMLSTIPFTIALMEPPTQKLLWVGEVADSATKTVGPPASTGIGVKVVDESRAAAAAELGLPEPANPGAITPIEEFEPFEDAIVGEEYEQLKVKKLLQMFDKWNAVKVFLPIAAGSLGLAAVFIE